jgi:hypothetical protein
MLALTLVSRCAADAHGFELVIRGAACWQESPCDRRRLRHESVLPSGAVHRSATRCISGVVMPESCKFQLRRWCEVVRCLPGRGMFIVGFEARAQRPVGRHEVPGGFVGRRGHARRVRRGVRQRTFAARQRFFGARAKLPGVVPA